MNGNMDFSFSKALTIFESGDEAIAVFVMILVIATLVFVALSSFGGLGFWGKNKEKIAEYSFKKHNRSEKIFVYKLSDNKGYRGYGIDFSNTKVTGGRINFSGSSVEFTKDEADSIVKLVGPYFGKISD